MKKVKLEFKEDTVSGFITLEYVEDTKNGDLNWHYATASDCYKTAGNPDYKFIAVTDWKHADKFADFCEAVAGINKKSRKARRFTALPFTGDQVRELWVKFLYRELLKNQ